MSLLPDFPRLPTLRSRIADGVFVALLLVARGGFVAGAALGAVLNGGIGLLIGLAVGVVIGLWTRRSLGLRRRRLTQGFVVRMLERGNNDRAKLLESLVERLHGYRLTPKQCRMIAAAHAKATRRLLTCESSPERRSILNERNREVLEAAYGRRARRASTACSGGLATLPQRF
jgi:hypothetical protein